MEKIERLRDEAAELPDGRKVFRSNGGRLIAEDGTDVTDQRDLLRNISSVAPTWEEFTAAQDQAADLHRRQVELEQFRTETLEPLRQRLNDPDNPMTADELRDLPKKIREAMPLDAKRFLDGLHIPREPYIKEAEPELSGGVNGPDVFKEFRSAASVITGNAFDPPALGTTPKR